VWHAVPVCARLMPCELWIVAATTTDGPGSPPARQRDTATGGQERSGGEATEAGGPSLGGNDACEAVRCHNPRPSVSAAPPKLSGSTLYRPTLGPSTVFFDGRERARQERNRISAATSRLRRQERLRALQEENTALRTQLAQEQATSAALRAELLELRSEAAAAAAATSTSA
jgi:hypothetical protein